MKKGFGVNKEKFKTLQEKLDDKFEDFKFNVFGTDRCVFIRITSGPVLFSEDRFKEINIFKLHRYMNSSLLVEMTSVVLSVFKVGEVHFRMQQGSKIVPFKTNLLKTLEML